MTEWLIHTVFVSQSSSVLKSDCFVSPLWKRSQLEISSRNDGYFGFKWPKLNDPNCSALLGSILTVRFNFHQLRGLWSVVLFTPCHVVAYKHFLFLELEALILHVAAPAAKSLRSCPALLGLTNYKHQDLKEGSHFVCFDLSSSFTTSLSLCYMCLHKRMRSIIRKYLLKWKAEFRQESLKLF